MVADGIKRKATIRFFVNFALNNAKALLSFLLFLKNSFAKALTLNVTIVKNLIKTILQFKLKVNEKYN